MPLDPVETLQELIRIPSVNPMGRPFVGGSVGEKALTDYLQFMFCERLCLPWLRQQVHPGRENLIAVIRGNPPAADGGELILWDVHQDTVSGEGMIVEPFAGEARDGRVCGRGACDVKGSMAAMIAAIARLGCGERLRRMPTVVIAFTVNEECGFTGAQSLCNLWQPDQQADAHVTSGTISLAEIFCRPPDLAIVAEPTDLQVVVAHQGMVRWRCRAIGRAAHSSRPDEGINAIYAMGRVAHAIEQFQRQLAAAEPHPLCGRPAVCITTIQGGVGINTVPDEATISIDRRIGPGENPADAFDELMQFIAHHVDLGGARLEHDQPFMKSSGLRDAGNRPIAERLATLVRGRGRACELVGAPYGTDAAAIGASGVPTVVFGPGSVRQAHTADEYIEVKELELGTELFHQIAVTGVR